MPLELHGGWVLDASARRHHFAGEGTLSIKSFRSGRALYSVGSGRVAVEHGQYFLLNEGQHYVIDIDAVAPVGSTCVFFPVGFARRMTPTLVCPPAALLDVPDRELELAFFERTYPMSSGIERGIETARLRARGDAIHFEEALHDLFVEMATVHHQVRAEIASAPMTALRVGTREELYRRLWRARDFIEATYDEPLTLTRIARVACLSPNHLLRCYRQLFGTSPGVWLRTVRLDRAYELVTKTSQPVTEIGLSVGYASAGSFSALFKRRFGIAPIQLREKVILKKRGYRAPATNAG